MNVGSERCWSSKPFYSRELNMGMVGPGGRGLRDGSGRVPHSGVPDGGGTTSEARPQFSAVHVRERSERTTRTEEVTALRERLVTISSTLT